MYTQHIASGEPKKHADFVLLLHAFKAGQRYKQLGLQQPFGLIYGGTDLNQMTEDTQQLVNELTRTAVFRVCFSDDFLRMCTMNWPGLAFLKCGQAVDILPVQTPSDEKCTLLICGIRPVKDPLMAVRGWEQANVSGKLKIIGPIIDVEYGLELQQAIKGTDSIEHIPYMEHADLMTELSRAYSTINSSLSEGQSAAVLESMAAGVPVIARDIPGNAIVTDDCGLNFENVDELAKRIQTLYHDGELRQLLGNNAREYIKKHHALEIERDFYRKLFR